MSIPALRQLLTEPRPSAPPVRVWRDVLLVAALVATVAFEVALRGEVSPGPVTLGVSLVLLLALLWRRTSPLAAVVGAFGTLGGVSVATHLGVDVPELYAWAWVLVLPYALFRWGAGREAALGLVVMLGSALLGVAVDATGALDSVVGLAILLLPAALGASIRYRTHSRLREVDQIRLLEREQLARELHDTVAHHVSAIAVQAQAGRAVAASDPARAVAALEVIETAASRTLTEMRTMVGILRAGEATAVAPQPGVADVRRLAAEDGDGPRVEVVLDGDLDPLAPSVDAAIYRLAQEAVTNAVRHAREATHIHVRVVGGETTVELTVSDDGRARPADPGPWGYGLIGMTERASLLGGTLEAGPGPGRGWTVTAVLPRSGGRT